MALEYLLLARNELGFLGGSAEVFLHLQGDKFEVTIHQEEGPDYSFQIWPSTLISTLRNAYSQQLTTEVPCKYSSVPDFNLFLDGVMLNNCETAEMFEMKDGDCIDMMHTQVGD